MSNFPSTSKSPSHNNWGSEHTGPAASTSSRTRILSRGDACWSCRRRKLRCDSRKPICGPCSKYQRPHECVYDEKPLTEVEKLEARVSELEGLLEAAISEEQSPSAAFLQPITDLPRPELTLFTVGPESPTMVIVLPPGIESSLMNVFLQYLYQFNFAIDLSKFRRSLALPEDDPNRPHPALLNAIYCIACHFADDTSLRQYENLFHRRAQQHLHDSLAHVDRLFDFLAGTTLLAQYNLLKGNLAKGSYLASSAMSFAAGCGLHQMSLNPTEPIRTETALLPSAENFADYLERVNVFSSVFQIERQASLESGVPLTLPDELIATPWPMSPDQDFTSLDRDSMSISAVFTRGSAAASVKGDVVLAIRAKVVALLERATRQARLASSQPFADGNFWDSYQTLDQALFRFKESLPALDVTMISQYPTIGNESRNAQDFFGIVPPSEEEAIQSRGWLCYTLVFAHVSIATAIIHLHGIFAERDDGEASVVLAAARDIAAIIRSIGTISAEAETSSTGVPVLSSLQPRRLHKLVGFGMNLAAQVLMREWRRRSVVPNLLARPESREIRIEVDMLRNALGIMANFYPGLQREHADLERILDSP